MKNCLLLILLILLCGNVAKSNCTTGSVSVPVVDSITVDIAGNVTICWQGLSDPDIDYYIIFMYNSVTGANDSINTVVAPGNCFILPFGSNNSDVETVELSVVGVDVCDNASTSGVNYHNTIFLDYEVDICAAAINLNWNSYDDFNSGTNVSYNVYVSQDAGPYTLVGTTTDTTFSFAGIVQGSTYNFFVRAYENGGAGPISSSSNDVQINTVNFLKDPQFNYLYTASVVDSQEILVQFFVDTAADVSHYNVKRRASTSEAFEVVGTVSAFFGMNPLVTFYDYDVDAVNTHYYYEVETINDCQDVKFTSNIGKTIWLNVDTEGNGVSNELTITQYDGWQIGVREYDIYRAVGGVWQTSPIATLTPFVDTITYVDNILNIIEGDGVFCYKVVAKETSAPHVGGLPIASSTSNESCVNHKPMIYVPNAFIPSSPDNHDFKPVLTFSNPEGYLLQVYNRWGQKIFETQDLNEAWNGRVNNIGELCQSDSYVYIVRFVSSFDGKEYKRSGVVTLLN